MTDAARFRHVVVPMDGSELSCNALGPAMSLGSAFGGMLHLVAVVVDEADGAAAHRGLESVAERFGIALMDEDAARGVLCFVRVGDVVDGEGSDISRRDAHVRRVAVRKCVAAWCRGHS
jgi:nucleotide-binding universal stress UspA family protein